MTGSDLYYWDSCLFLAWLRDEKNRPEGEMAGVRSYIQKVKAREIRLITSAITYTEVLYTKLPVGVGDQFSDLLRSSNVNVVAADIRVTKLARQLRDYYREASDGETPNKTLSVPDAIHLATAILYKANEFHTFDGDNNKNSLGLLRLNGDVGGHRLIICKPENDQRELDLS